MTFCKGIQKLLIAEGYNLQEYASDAKSMDSNLIYVVRFCKENEIHLNYENIRGILIAVWSLVGESDFTNEEAADELITEILTACK